VNGLEKRYPGYVKKKRMAGDEKRTSKVPSVVDQHRAKKDAEGLHEKNRRAKRFERDYKNERGRSYEGETKRSFRRLAGR